MAPITSRNDYASTKYISVSEFLPNSISRTDELSGLFNQRAFYEYLRRNLGLAERYQEPISLYYLDLNGFKALNDEKGHKAGNAILATVSFSIGTIDTGQEGFLDAEALASQADKLMYQPKAKS